MPSPGESVDVHLVLSPATAWLVVRELGRSGRGLAGSASAKELRQVARVLREALEAAGCPEPAPVFELEELRT